MFPSTTSGKMCLVLANSLPTTPSKHHASSQALFLLGSPCVLVSSCLRALGDIAQSGEMLPAACHILNTFRHDAETKQCVRPSMCPASMLRQSRCRRVPHAPFFLFLTNQWTGSSKSSSRMTGRESLVWHGCLRAIKSTRRSGVWRGAIPPSCCIRAKVVHQMLFSMVSPCHHRLWNAHHAEFGIHRCPCMCCFSQRNEISLREERWERARWRPIGLVRVWVWCGLLTAPFRANRVTRC